MKLSRVLNSVDIHLKSLSLEDSFQSYFEWFSDQDVMRFLEVRFNPPASIFELENFVTSINESEHSIMAGIFLNNTNDHIGNVKIGSIDKNHSTANIGYLIGERSAWGKGYASQAIRLVVGYAFSDLNLIKVTAGCSQGNEGSLKALLKAGFTQEGFLASQLIMDGQRRGVYQMGIINPSVKDVDK
jgi:ribosomal-protein-alanine N-acetyltransferase